ncbi:MAG TPA: hypothetical protein VLA89_10780 [Gemmatimonadales bacterium]|nr:hypothetical protein [Gemmatimonadales bacterium]
MPETPLAGWESFYVILGSSAAALTGLQFVVMALVADIPRAGSIHDIATYGTPSVVHFCTALLISAILSAPWPDLEAVHIPLLLTAAAGMVYMVIVIQRARARGQYQPVMEDWIWHTILPFIAYAVLVGSALKLQDHPAGALFLIGGATLLLVFIGIHNAWDTVVWIATQEARRNKAESKE